MHDIRLNRSRETMDWGRREPSDKKTAALHLPRWGAGERGEGVEKSVGSDATGKNCSSATCGKQMPIPLRVQL